MKKVLLVMRRKVLADGICKALQQVPDLHPLIELNEDQAMQIVPA